MIKPDFWGDSKLAAQCSRDARFLYIAIWNASDDYGVVRADPRWLMGQLWPYENISLAAFKKVLRELEDAKRILEFKSGSEFYYWIPTFQKHQSVCHPNKVYRNPSPPKELMDNYIESINPSGNPLESSGNPLESSGNPPEDSRKPLYEREVEVEVEREVKDSCSELRSAPSEPPADDPVFLTIPLIRSEGVFEVRESFVKQLEKRFFELDVRKSVRCCAAWCDETPGKRKTRRGIRHAITAWCIRDINSGKNLKPGGAVSTVQRGRASPEKPVVCKYCGVKYRVRLKDDYCPACSEPYYQMDGDGQVTERFPGDGTGTTKPRNIGSLMGGGVK